MKVKYKPSNSVELEFESGSVKEAFEKLSSVQEVFGAAKTCGCCQSKDVRLVVRENEGFTFYEARCQQCHARLEFGQPKAGGLFPKRKDETGAFKPNEGWFIYRAPESGHSQPAHHPQASQSHSTPPQSNYDAPF